MHPKGCGVLPCRPSFDGSYEPARCARCRSPWSPTTVGRPIEYDMTEWARLCRHPDSGEPAGVSGDAADREEPHALEVTASRILPVAFSGWPIGHAARKSCAAAPADLDTPRRLLEKRRTLSAVAVTGRGQRNASRACRLALARLLRVLALALSPNPAAAQDGWPWSLYPSLRKQAAPAKRTQPRPPRQGRTESQAGRNRRPRSAA